ncbi:A-kinase anchor protein 1, mitochondrial [Emydura macquarii macquarii]|uniref:A-kinase anchor protein 1, mitochondrial n=1 Tax=Emydura macquarii macquarii TaxID=1129001 RepID=UPI00352A0C72
MALRFRTFFPYALPGVLALIGWWWFFSRKKERTSSHDRQALAGVEDQRIEPLSGEEVNATKELPALSEEDCRENETLTSKLSVGLMTASLAHETQQRLNSSRDLPVTAVTTVELCTFEDDSEKLERAASQEENGSLAQVSPPPAPKSVECCDDAVLVTQQESTLNGVPDQQPLVCSVVEPIQESLGKTRESGKAEMTHESLEDPSEEIQCPETSSSDTDCLPVLGSEAEDSATAQPAVLDEDDCKEVEGVVQGQRESVVGKLLNNYVESACSDLSGEEEVSEMIISTVPKCQGREEKCYWDTQLKGDGLERERIGGVSLDKDEVEKIEQVAIQIISKVILAATEEVLSSSVSDDVSSGICQVAVSRVDRPLERVSISSDEMLAVEFSRGNETVTTENVATIPAPISEEKLSHCMSYSSCLKYGRLSNPVDPKDRRPKKSVHSGTQGPNRTLVTNQGESFEESHAVTEDSGCSACTSEDGTSGEDPLQSTSLSLLSGQHSDLLSMSVIQDASMEQNMAQREKPRTPILGEDKVPYSNGMLKGDGADLRHEKHWTTETDADHSGGSDVNSMDSVDSGCALGKTENCHNSKPGAESNKSELTIWEIEVPKHLVGRLIGKQGRYVSFLKQTSGAKIYISTLPYTQDIQICHIEGSQHHVDKALSLIGKKFKELSLTNIYVSPAPSLMLHSLPMTSWLMLPDGVTVEVIVVNQVNAGHMFVQQHTHPTFHVLRSLDQQMYVCYSQPGIPTLPTPVEVGVICAAPGLDGAWWRAQVVGYFKDNSEVEIRYVDYGGYERVKIDTLRQIRSDFVTLPFQGAEVLLDNVVPLPDEDHFSSEADSTVSEMTRGTPLLAQVTNYDSATGLPLIQLWSMMGDEVVSINRALVERGFAQWIDSY